MYAYSEVIYADLLFIINFVIDFLCLYITSRIIGRGLKVIRMLLASTVGGLYAFLPYLITIPLYISIPIHIISAYIITLIAYGKSYFKRDLIATLGFIISSALLGGLITAFYGVAGIGYGGSAITLIITSIISAGITFVYGIISKKRVNVRSVDVRVIIGKTATDLNLLVDSGNLVTEPFSALPVIVVSSTSLPPPFDRPESEMFPKPIRAIPFQTSAGRGCFFGFRPDRIEIIHKTKKPITVDAFIGIDTAKKSFSGYDGLIPTSLI